jgi:hypothetical protein
VIFRPSVLLPSELTMMIRHTLGLPAGIVDSSSRSNRREKFLLIICQSPDIPARSLAARRSARLGPTR